MSMHTEKPIHDLLYLSNYRNNLNVTITALTMQLSGVVQDVEDEGKRKSM